mgnify:CR=1 FL=1
MKTTDKKPAEKKENKAEKETKPTTEKVVVAETPKETPIHPLDALIENIKADQILLKEKELLIKEAKDDKNDILSRLKGRRKDLSVFLKYATEEQKQEIESLGFGSENNESRMNDVAQITLNIMTQKKKLTNNELHEEYEKVVKEKKEIPEKYTAFNIKIRGLFNRQLLIRTRGNDESSSREDIITLNGGEN